jgi:ESS family glutamate:Na+ symporter
VLILLMGAVGMKLPLQLGLFLPLGFTQGPGQALAVAKVWEAEGFANAVSLGLAFAAIGFFFALFVGIPLINWGIRKGYTKLGTVQLPDYFRKGIYSKDQIDQPTGMMTTHSGNVDSLAFQAAAVGIVYMLTYLGYWAVGLIFGPPGKSAWGFFFFFGMLLGIVVRVIMQKLGSGYLLNRDTQNRITSLGVDVLVTATLISVKLSVVWAYIVPLVVIAAAGGLWTTFYMLYFGRRVGELGFERMCVQFGCNTGTVSTGLLLLRVVDSKFNTTASLETGLYSIFATPFILGTMLVILYAPKWGLTVLHQMGIYLGMFLLALILLKVFRLWGKKQW